MKLLGRAGRPTPGPELDNRLHDIFDDRRTPGAPEALYRYLGDLAMDSSAAPEPGRFGFSWSRMGRVGRVAAAMAVVAVVGAGLFAVTVGVPLGLGTSRSGMAARTIPTAPAAPSGWSQTISFGTDGPDGLWGGANLDTPSSRISIDVVCNGPDDVVVMASTVAGPSWIPSGPVQAATFPCVMGGQESRVELIATSGSFQAVAAVVVRNPSSIVDTSYVVSIEVPDGTPLTNGPPSPSPWAASRRWGCWLASSI